MINDSKLYNQSLSSGQSFIYFILIGFCTLYLDAMPIVDKLFSLLRLGVSALVFAQFFAHRTKLGWFVLLMACYWAFVLYTTRLHHGHIVGVISYGITILALFISMQKDLEINPVGTMKTLCNIFSFFIYANFITLLLFPNGIWMTEDGNARFLIGGNYNQMGGFIIVGLTTNLAYYHMNPYAKRSSLFLLFSIALLTVTLVGSQTSTVGVAALLLFVLAPTEKIRKLGFVAMIVLYFIFQHLTVFSLTEYSENSYFGKFITQGLKKDLTFTERTTIWRSTQLMIIKSPVIGYGRQDEEWHYANIDGMMPHNWVLTLLLKGGVVLLGIFVIIMIYCMRCSIHNHSPANFYIMCGAWVLASMMIMEVYNIGLICYLLCLMANADKLKLETT